MKYFVYVLTSIKDHNLYIGISKNPAQRLKEHNSGQVRTTRTRRPLQLIYVDEAVSRKEARGKEKYLKSGIGRECLRELIKHSQ